MLIVFLLVISLGLYEDFIHKFCIWMLLAMEAFCVAFQQPLYGTVFPIVVLGVSFYIVK